MWRAFFLAMGISMVIVGAQFLVVERVVLATESPAASAPANDQRYLFGGPNNTASFSRGKEVVPPSWAPWSLMSAGAVVIIYSFTIPKRVAS
ncbi:MAG: hypothetical protein KDA41_13420 [Planctomycetales bacterium]|nr:hypothetical protein [Planctomycetales bacterium]